MCSLYEFFGAAEEELRSGRLERVSEESRFQDNGCRRRRSPRNYGGRELRRGGRLSWSERSKNGVVHPAAVGFHRAIEQMDDVAVGARTGFCGLFFAQLHIGMLRLCGTVRVGKAA